MSRWVRVLVSILGALEVLMAIGARPGWIATVGILGGVGVVAGPWMPDRRWRRAVLLLGAVPFAALTWWSLVSPLVAVLAVTLGFRGRREPTVNASPASSSDSRSG